MCWLVEALKQSLQLFCEVKILARCHRGGSEFRLQGFGLDTANPRQLCFRETRVYQIPEANKTTEQAPVNRMRNGEGNIRHATIAPPPDNPGT